MTDTQAKSYGELFGALADSLIVSRSFNPTAVPRPKVEEDERWRRRRPADRRRYHRRANRESCHPMSMAKARPRASSCRRATADRCLATREVFEKVSGAVYVVKAQHKMGSGVAISDRELLTNCHVVNESPNVTIGRGKKDQSATVVSMNIGADRLVTARREQAAELGEGAALRRHQDRRARHHRRHAAGAGAHGGRGLVSSKRTHKGSRLVQTSAPSSPRSG